MIHMSRIVLVTAVLMLAPCAARADGWDQVAEGFTFSFSGALIGSLAGMVIALRRKAETKGVVGRSIATGMAGGLGAAGLVVVTNATLFFPHNAPIALVIAASAIIFSVAGGLVFGLIAAAFRNSLRDDPDKKPPSK